MRKTLMTAIAAFALSTGAAFAGGPGVSVSFSGDVGAANNGSIGSGAYSKTDYGTAYSVGKSSVKGNSYSSVCGACDAYTSVNFNSVSSTETFSPASNGYSEAYGFNETNWRTNVDKSLSGNFDWGGYGYDD